MAEPVSYMSDVLVDVADAKGLPNKHYVSTETFREERDGVFATSWAAVGFGKDVPNPGDLKPIDFLGIPLLIARDKSGAIRTFQNTCRHRGMKLVSEEVDGKNVIRCPYHSWCYSLEGALVTTPHVGGPGNNTNEHIKREELGLFEFASYVWQDIIFVNLDGKAEPFETCHKHLLERWKDFNQPIYYGGAESSFSLNVNCNWKLAVENYCESYHLPWVHPDLNSYSRLEDHYHIVQPGCFSGQGTVVYNPDLGIAGKQFKNFDGLPAKWDRSAEYISLFPNVLLGVHRDHVFALILQPQDQENTVEQIAIYYPSKDATSDEFKPLREKNASLWKTVFSEDIFVVEGMQKGRHGPRFDGGKFSPVMDEPTHTFHHWIASRMAAHGNANANSGANTSG